jgi:hypothetical protein
MFAAIGLALFFGSFFLRATAGTLFFEDLMGYDCALISLSTLWGGGPDMRHDQPFEYVSLVISGCINPVFLTAAALAFWKPRSSAALALGALTLVSIPFCWIVFWYEGLYPRGGHIAWVLGMVLTLAAARRVRSDSLDERQISLVKEAH